MSHGLTRLVNRFLEDPDHARKLAAEPQTFDVAAADEQGLVTFVYDDRNNFV